MSMLPSTKEHKRILKIEELSKILIGRKFHRLRVLKFSHWGNPSPKNSTSPRYWLCRCDCGTIKPIVEQWLIRNGIHSCGCYLKEKSSEIIKEYNAKHLPHPCLRHGLSDTKFYRAWYSMKGRIFNPNSKHFKFYGGKGIKLDSRWSKFDNFKADMYESFLQHCSQFGEENTTLDRIDPSGDYSPQNCRWATWEQQLRNKSDIRVFLNWENKLWRISDLAKTYGVPTEILRGRLFTCHWTLEKALFTPYHPFK